MGLISAIDRPVGEAEITQFDHQQRKMLVITAAARGFLRRQHMKIALVIKSGERVNIGHATQFIGELDVANGGSANVGSGLRDGAVIGAEKLRRSVRHDQRSQGFAHGDQGRAQFRTRAGYACRPVGMGGQIIGHHVITGREGLGDDSAMFGCGKVLRRLLLWAGMSAQHKLTFLVA